MRPIDGDAVLVDIEELKKSPWYTQCISNTERLIKKEAVEIVEDLCIRKAPTIDYAPVVHREWVECDWVEYDNHDECVHYPKQGLKCTACFNVFKKELLWKRNYCPNCGAKMDGGKENV